MLFLCLPSKGGLSLSHTHKLAPRSWDKTSLSHSHAQKLPSRSLDKILTMMMIMDEAKAEQGGQSPSKILKTP